MRCVHVTRGYVVPLCRPVNGAIILNIKLLNNEKKNIHVLYYSLVPNLSARLNE